jgi:glycosyltransferase involved in cell wall biosynthesis
MDTAHEGNAEYSVSVIVPVYNSSTMLETLCRRVDEAISKITLAYEIVLVNDGSRDASWEAIQTISRKHKNITGINLMRNYGQHNALLCGIRKASYDYIVTIDDDLQNPPEEIPILLNKVREGYDVVYGSPEKERHGLFRDLASRMTKMVLQHAMGADVARDVSAFRAFRTDLRKGFSTFNGSFVSIDVLLTWSAQKYAVVKVKHAPRQEGISNYTFRKLLTHAMNMMTGFSTLPLQFASIVGFAFTLFGFVILGYVLVKYLMYGSVVQGFAFLASIIAVFSGATLFSMGIIGEYLARIHFRVMDKPSYAEREVIESQ